MYPAYLQVTDIAGLIRGASKGEGLGNAFLSHIQAVDGSQGPSCPVHSFTLVQVPLPHMSPSSGHFACGKETQLTIIS